jgi:hypothetical protein
MKSLISARKEEVERVVMGLEVKRVRITDQRMYVSMALARSRLISDVLNVIRGWDSLLLLFMHLGKLNRLRREGS